MLIIMVYGVDYYRGFITSSSLMFSSKLYANYEAYLHVLVLLRKKDTHHDRRDVLGPSLQHTADPVDAY